MSEKPKSVSFIYEKNKNSITFPVSGAYGGPNPDNSGIVVHFYVEFPSVPHSTDFPIQEGQKVIDMKSGKNILRGDYTREVQSTAFMNAETAVMIGEWLKSKGELLIKRRRGKDPNPEDYQ